MAIDKNYKPTERDFFQFNAWCKSKNIRPRLLRKFKSEQDYEAFMIEAQDKYMYCESGRTFSKDREKVPADILEKAKTDGVVQQDKDGNWRIISLKDGEFWNAHYQTKESAEAALRGYHAQKGFSMKYNHERANKLYAYLLTAGFKRFDKNDYSSWMGAEKFGNLDPLILKFGKGSVILYCMDDELGPVINIISRVGDNLSIPIGELSNQTLSTFCDKSFSNLYNDLPRNEHDQISVDESIPEGTTEGFYDDFMFYPSKGDWKLDFMNSDYGDREMDAVVIVEDGIAEIYAVDDFVKGKKSKDQK